MKSKCPDCNADVIFAASAARVGGVYLEAKRATVFLVSIEQGPPKRTVAEIATDTGYYVEHVCKRSRVADDDHGSIEPPSALDASQETRMRKARMVRSERSGVKRARYAAARKSGHDFRKALAMAGYKVDGCPQRSIVARGCQLDVACGLRKGNAKP